MTLERLETFLDDHHTKYTTIKHSRAFTAQGIAAAAHIAGKELAKTVMVRIDGKLAMAVLPAPQRVDLELVDAETLQPVSSLEQFRGLFSGLRTRRDAPVRQPLRHGGLRRPHVDGRRRDRFQRRLPQ